jgi:predicted Zn-dependent peptidase
VTLLEYPIARHRLDNGLSVIISEDHATPTASVLVRYGVGSREEKPGRTGLAHLFEHMMFRGSRDVPDGEHARLLQAIGAEPNADTTADATCYHERFPTGALDLALWLEANRLGTLTEALTQVALDNQRAVVVQEKFQRFDNQPYGRAPLYVHDLLFPAGHPYRHVPIGSLEDLHAASLEDVAGFFATHYRPGNAVLSIVGDVNPDEVIDSVERYFGSILATVSAAPTAPRPAAAASGAFAPLEPLTAPVRLDAHDPVPLPALLIGFRLPPAGPSVSGGAGGEAEGISPLRAALLALRVLAGGEGSRLHRRLVREEQLAREVQLIPQENEAAASLGLIFVIASPGADLDAIEKVVLDELEQLAQAGPSDPETARALAQGEHELLAAPFTGLVTGLGRARALARYTAVADDPYLVNGIIGRLYRIGAPDIHHAAARWLRPEARAVIAFHPTVPALPVPAGAAPESGN